MAAPPGLKRTAGGERAHLPDTTLSPALECQNDSFLVNTVEIPTHHHLCWSSPTDALAAQMVVLMMLTRMFDISHNVSVLGLCRSREDWTHSSILAEYARLGDLAAL